MRFVVVVFFAFAALLYPVLDAGAACSNTAGYVLKGYMEDSNNTPVTGKTLSTVLFDIYYDDGTSSTGNQATAEMGQGWYRYAYTSNGKNGVWIMRDSGSTYKNFPGGILESLCGAQVLTPMVNAIWNETQSGHTTAGTFGKYLDAQVSTVGGGGTDWTADEKNQLRYRLGIDGTEAAPLTNTPSLSVDLNANQAGVTIGMVSTVTNGVTVTTNNDKTGYALSTAGVDSILDDTVEGSLTLRQMVKIMAAALAGKAAGGGTTTITFTGLDGTTTRITATVDANGNRTATTVNGN